MFRTCKSCTLCLGVVQKVRENKQYMCCVSLLKTVISSPLVCAMCVMFRKFRKSFTVSPLSIRIGRRIVCVYESHNNVFVRNSIVKTQLKW